MEVPLRASFGMAQAVERQTELAEELKQARRTGNYQGAKVLQAELDRTIKAANPMLSWWSLTF